MENSNMSSEVPVSPPTSTEGITIHLSYIRKDLADIRTQLGVMNSNFLKTSDFSEYRKIVETEMKDHESRLRKLEMWGAIAIGIIYVVQFVSKFIHL